jgi:RpiB/LacA/LacB family sugar-phosphate isomerase
MIVYLGADHRGFVLKEKIKAWLEAWDYKFSDLGAFKYNTQDDYPLYAEKVGSIVGSQKAARGILICGSGVGMAIAANKLDGVRAAIGKSSQQIRKAREDDDMNILVLAADFTPKKEVQKIVKNFLATKFLGEARHKRRLQEIKRIEANN